MKIVNHKLQGVPYKASPNIGGVIKPIYFIIHYDASPNATGAINWMTNKQSKVSAHIHIDRAGNIVQLVDFNRAAYHAGVSNWKGLSGLNSHSIGVELQNTGIQEYTKEQLDSLVKVTKLIVEAYPIKEILGHSDIAPKRKIDPGKQFPMGWFIGEVFGESGVKTKHTTADLNLRTGVGTNNPVMEVLPKGTEVNVLSEKDGWVEIFVCNSKSHGWVSNSYLK